MSTASLVTADTSRTVVVANAVVVDVDAVDARCRTSRVDPIVVTETTSQPFRVFVLQTRSVS